VRAALLYAHQEPFRLEDIPAPTAGPGEVLVKVVASAVCGGDLHRHDGGIGVDPMPSVIGHQVAGVVAEVGDAVPQRFGVGDRVTVVPFVRCGTCRNCRRGRDNICTSQDDTWSILRGYYGGYAEYVSVPHGSLVGVPDNVSLVDAASLPDAFGTPYHAVRRADVQKGDVAVVFGAGDIGTALVQLLRIAGAEVVAVDVHTEKLQLALSVGATHTIDARTVNPAQAIAALTDEQGADMAFEAAGLEVTTMQAVECVRRGGSVVLVGATDDPLREFSTMPYAEGGSRSPASLTCSGRGR